MSARDAGRPATLGLLGRLVTFCPWRYGLAALGWMLFHLWPLVPGLAGKLLFDVLEGRAAPGVGVTTVVAIVVAAGLARCAAILGATIAWAGWYLRARALVQRNLLDRLFRRPGAQPMAQGVGEYVSTVRDDSDAIAMLGGWGFDTLSGLAFAVGGLAIMASIDLQVTAFVVVPIVVVVALSQVVRSRLTRLRHRAREATARVTGAIAEIVSGVVVIKATDSSGHVLDRLRRLGADRRRAMLRDKVQSIAIEAVFNSTASVGAGLVLLVAAGRIRGGSFTIGDFVLFSTYLLQVAHYTGFMGYLVRTYLQSGVSFSRAAALLEDEPAVRLAEHHSLHLGAEPAPAREQRPAEPLRTLEVRSLSAAFPGERRGIEDVSLTLRPGTTTVVTGEVGSGKTTLLRCVLGLYPRDAGTIRWNGRTIEDPGGTLVPPLVAYTPQAPVLLSGTVRENILLGLPDDGRAEDAVALVALGPDLATFDDGFATEIGVRGVRLSGGQVQRVAAARMLAGRPELLVMDDLSSALDVETEQELWERLLARSATCLAVSHRPAVLERADQVVLLKDGRVEATGTLRELLVASPEMRKHYREPQRA